MCPRVKFVSLILISCALRYDSLCVFSITIYFEKRAPHQLAFYSRPSFQGCLYRMEHRYSQCFIQISFSLYVHTAKFSLTSHFVITYWLRHNKTHEVMRQIYLGLSDAVGTQQCRVHHSWRSCTKCQKDIVNNSS